MVDPYFFDRVRSPLLSRHEQEKTSTIIFSSDQFQLLDANFSVKLKLISKPPGQ